MIEVYICVLRNTPDLRICVGLFFSYLQFVKGHQKIKPKEVFFNKIKPRQIFKVNKTGIEKTHADSHNQYKSCL